MPLSTDLAVLKAEQLKLLRTLDETHRLLQAMETSLNELTGKVLEHGMLMAELSRAARVAKDDK